MITDNRYFSQRIDEVLQLVHSFDKDALRINRGGLTQFTKEEALSFYNETFLSFPYSVEEASNNIGISVIAMEIFDSSSDLEYKERYTDIEISKIKKRRESFCASEQLYTINDYLELYFHELVYNYSSFLKTAKEICCFVNIENEKIILINLLNLYKSVLKDSTKQIDIFWCITLPKKISDQILMMIVDFIEQRLSILNISFDKVELRSKNTYVTKRNDSKIIWKGNQQQLCELFIELEQKQWIEKIQIGERKRFVESISDIFDFEQTRRRGDSDIINSLYQIFKGDVSKTGRAFPFMEKDNYKRSFENIEKNNN